MLSHHLGRALAIASALLLSACKSFSPDGGMSTVAEVAGGGLNKNVVRISSAADASLARSEVARLLQAPLGADAAVQIALLNNAGLQAAYNRLGVAEAVDGAGEPAAAAELFLRLGQDLDRARCRTADRRKHPVARHLAGAIEARRRPLRAGGACAPPRRPCVSRRRRGAHISAPSLPGRS